MRKPHCYLCTYYVCIYIHTYEYKRMPLRGDKNKKPQQQKTFINIVSPFSIFINKYTAFLDSMSASSEGGAGGTVGGSAVGTATTTAPGMY